MHGQLWPRQSQFPVRSLKAPPLRIFGEAACMRPHGCWITVRLFTPPLSPPPCAAYAHLFLLGLKAQSAHGDLELLHGAKSRGRSVQALR